MNVNRKFYKWFYDNIHSKYYDLLMWWCFFPFGGEQKVRDKLLSKVSFKKGDKILDMCCGTGNETFAIAKHADKSVIIKGMDLSDGQIKMARSKNKFPNVSFQAMDAAKTSYSNDEFDKVIVAHALHEMPRDVRINVLKEAKRILKRGGTVTILDMDNPPSFWTRLLIGFVWFYWLPFNFETPTRRDMLKRGLLKEVQEAGFVAASKTNMFKGVFQVVQAKK